MLVIGYKRQSKCHYGAFLSGGLAEEVDEKVLHAAFIPFGDITDIQIPLDYETGKISVCVCVCLIVTALSLCNSTTVGKMNIKL